MMIVCMYKYDITFCNQWECPKGKCRRHPSRMKGDMGRLYSMADFSKNCGMDNDYEEYWEEK